MKNLIIKELTKAITLCLILLATPGAWAVTRTWDGGATGTGTDLGVAANWSGDALPTGATPDVMQWDGTVSGNLSLTYTTPQGSLATSPGLSINVMAAQSGTLGIDLANASSNLRIGTGGITIASGAGAFSLGNNSGTGTLNLGTSSSVDMTASFLNNSVNTATIYPDAAIAPGGTANLRSLTFGGTGNWDVRSVISGRINLTKTSAGTLTLSGANTYTGGTTIGASAGAAVIRAAATQALGTGTIAFDGTGNASTARLELSGGISLPNAIALAGRNNSSVAIQNITGNNTLTGTITMSSGGSTYLIQSDAGLLTLGSTGATALNAASSTRNATLQGAGNGIVAGNIINGAGTVSLTKAGAGTWTLAGANTFTGSTTVSGGTLLVNGSLAAGSTVSVSGSGTTLGGSGTINGATSISAGGALTPRPSGGSATTLTFGGNLTLSSATGNFTLDATAAGSNDKIAYGSSSTLTLNSSDTINITALSGLETSTPYTLFSSGAGTVSMATMPALVINGSSSDQATPGNYKLAVVGGSLVLQYIPLSTPPTVNSAIASPSSLVHNQTTTITVNVSPASGQSITSVSVTADGLGGSGDPTTLTDAGSGNWTGTFTVPANKAFSSYSISGTVVQSDSATAPWAVNGLTVSASSPVWDGGGVDANWSTGNNWSGSPDNLAPGTTGDSVKFSGNTQTSPNLDTSYGLAGMTFDSFAGSFTIGTGNSSTLTLTAGTGVANNSSSLQTLNVPIAMSAPQTFAAAGDIAVGGVVSGTGSLTKTGNGTLTLTADNTFTGSVFAKGGSIVLDSGTINNGGNYSSIGQDGSDVATMTIKGSGSFTSTADFNVGDVGDSTGTLNIQDNATLKVGAFFVGSAYASDSTATGTVNQSGGTVTQQSGSIGTFVIGGRASTSSTGGDGTYNLSGGSLTAIAPVRMSGYGSATFNQSGGTFTAASVNGGINLQRFPGPGGTYNLDGGVANLNNIDASVASTDPTFHSVFNFNGGTLKPTATKASGFMAAHLSAANVRNGGAIIDTDGFSVSIEQVLQHSAIEGDNATDGGLTKNGAGTLTLTGANTYTGPTTVNAGTLQIASDSQLGAVPGSPAVNLTLNGGTLYNNNSTPTLSATRTISLGSSGGYLQAGWAPANSMVVSGQITGSGGLGINWDAAPVVLNAVNNYQGDTTIGSAGPSYWANNAANPTLRLGIDNALPYGASAGNVVFGTSANNNTATLDLNGHNQQINGLSGSANAIIDNNSGTGTYTLTAGNNDAGGTFAGVIRNTVGTVALTKAGSGTLTLSGANTYTGPTVISAGTLALSGAGSLTSPSISVGTGAIFDVSGVTGGGYALNSAGTLAMQIAKSGATLAQGRVTATSLTAGGTLTVTATGDALTAGDTFDLFDGEISGTFATVNLPGGNGRWNIDNLYTSGVIEFKGNSAVSAASFTLGVAVGGSTTANVVGKYASDPDAGDVITITEVSTPAHGTVSIQGGNIVYTSTGTAGSDSFTYKVSDGLSTATATVTVTITAPTGNGANIITVIPGSGTADVKFAGIPGAHYAIERSTDLTTWTEVVADVLVPANGIATWTDNSAPSSAYYRTRYVSGL